MTEWTMDLMVPTTEAQDGETAEGVAPPEVSPWPELGTGSGIDDMELDQEDWF